MISALAVSAVVLSSCSWDSPGIDRYVGSTVQAVNNYTDIPAPVRDILIKRMERKNYDDIVEITRDKISGKSTYTDLRDMHFGKNKICKTITREKWKPGTLERALIFCEQGHCIAIPTVCGNVSRISRINEAAPVDPPSSAGANSLSSQTFVQESQPTLSFDRTVLTPPEVITTTDNFVVVKKGEDPPPSFLPPPYTPPPIFIVPPPIPEIPSWLMFTVGFLVICRIVASKKFNK